MHLFYWSENQIEQGRRRMTDLTVGLLFLYGFSDILFSLPLKLTWFEQLNQYYTRLLHPDVFVIHRSLETMIGFILMLISYRLYKRMKLAWGLAMMMLPLSIMLHLFKYHDILTAFGGIESFILLILLINHKEFERSSDPITIRKGLIFAGISFSVLILNTALGISLIKGHYKVIERFDESLVESIRLLFFMDTSMIEVHTHMGRMFSYSALVINWVCILVSLIFILKPLVYTPLMTRKDRQKVGRLLNKHNMNPITYVAIEEDKHYYFSRNQEGAIAYTVAGKVAVCAGDPICSEEGFPELISGFMTYCRQNELDICFCQTSDRFVELFKAFGMGVAKYGEEAMFELASYNLVGSKMQKIRSAINTAARKGIQVYEYKPLSFRNESIENQIDAISKEWLRLKKSSELTFMLGSIGLRYPMDKRYFYAADEAGEMLGFIVFTPFSGGKGYHADVTRRRSHAPVGTMEKIIIEAFQTMKEEGVEWGSLGLAPLANVRNTEERNIVSDALMEFIYENMNQFYGFKALHHYKKKYNPTHWIPRYLVFYPKVFTPKIAFSIMKAQNPKGVGDFIGTQIKAIFSNNQDEIL